MEEKYAGLKKIAKSLQHHLESHKRENADLRSEMALRDARIRELEARLQNGAGSGQTPPLSQTTSPFPSPLHARAPHAPSPPPLPHSHAPPLPPANHSSATTSSISIAAAHPPLLNTRSATSTAGPYTPTKQQQQAANAVHNEQSDTPSRRPCHLPPPSPSTPTSVNTTTTNTAATTPTRATPPHHPTSAHNTLTPTAAAKVGTRLRSLFGLKSEHGSAKKKAGVAASQECSVNLSPLHASTAAPLHTAPTPTDHQTNHTAAPTPTEQKQQQTHQSAHWGLSSSGKQRVQASLHASTHSTQQQPLCTPPHTAHQQHNVCIPDGGQSPEVCMGKSVGTEGGVSQSSTQKPHHTSDTLNSSSTMGPLQRHLARLRAEQQGILPALSEHTTRAPHPATQSVSVAHAAPTQSVSVADPAVEQQQPAEQQQQQLPDQQQQQTQQHKGPQPYPCVPSTVTKAEEPQSCIQEGDKEGVSEDRNVGIIEGINAIIEGSNEGSNSSVAQDTVPTLHAEGIPTGLACDSDGLTAVCDDTAANGITATDGVHTAAVGGIIAVNDTATAEGDSNTLTTAADESGESDDIGSSTAVCTEAAEQGVVKAHGVRHSTQRQSTQRHSTQRTGSSWGSEPQEHQGLGVHSVRQSTSVRASSGHGVSVSVECDGVAAAGPSAAAVPSAAVPSVPSAAVPSVVTDVDEAADGQHADVPVPSAVTDVDEAADGQHADVQMESSTEEEGAGMQEQPDLTQQQSQQQEQTQQQSQLHKLQVPAHQENEDGADLPFESGMPKTPDQGRDSGYGPFSPAVLAAKSKMNGSLSASSALMGSPITVGHVHAQFDDTLDVSRADSHSKLAQSKASHHDQGGEQANSEDVPRQSVAHEFARMQLTAEDDDQGKDTCNYECTIRESVAQQFGLLMQAQMAAAAATESAAAQGQSSCSEGVQDTVNYEGTVQDSFVQQFEQMQAQAVAHASAQLSQQAAEHDAEGTARDTVNYECTIRESVALQFERMRDALAAGGEQQLSSAEAVPVTARVVPASHHHASPYTGRGRFDGDTRSLTDSSEDGDWDEEELDDDGESDAIDPGLAEEQDVLPQHMMALLRPSAPAQPLTHSNNNTEGEDEKEEEKEEAEEQGDECHEAGGSKRENDDDDGGDGSGMGGGSAAKEGRGFGNGGGSGEGWGRGNDRNDDRNDDDANGSDCDDGQDGGDEGKGGSRCRAVQGRGSAGEPSTGASLNLGPAADVQARGDAATCGEPSTGATADVPSCEEAGSPACSVSHCAEGSGVKSAGVGSVEMGVHSLRSTAEGGHTLRSTAVNSIEGGHSLRAHQLRCTVSSMGSSGDMNCMMRSMAVFKVEGEVRSEEGGVREGEGESMGVFEAEGEGMREGEESMGVFSVEGEGDGTEGGTHAWGSEGSQAVNDVSEGSHQAVNGVKVSAIPSRASWSSEEGGEATAVIDVSMKACCRLSTCMDESDPLIPAAAEGIGDDTPLPSASFQNQTSTHTGDDTLLPSASFQNHISIHSPPTSPLSFPSAALVSSAQTPPTPPVSSAHTPSIPPVSNAHTPQQQQQHSSCSTVLPADGHTGYEHNDPLALDYLHYNTVYGRQGSHSLGGLDSRGLSAVTSAAGSMVFRSLQQPHPHHLHQHSQQDQQPANPRRRSLTPCSNIKLPSTHNQHPQHLNATTTTPTHTSLVITTATPHTPPTSTRASPLARMSVHEECMSVCEEAEDGKEEDVSVSLHKELEEEQAVSEATGIQVGATAEGQCAQRQGVQSCDLNCDLDRGAAAVKVPAAQAAHRMSTDAGGQQQCGEKGAATAAQPPLRKSIWATSGTATGTTLAPQASAQPAQAPHRRRWAAADATNVSASRAGTAHTAGIAAEPHSKGIASKAGTARTAPKTASPTCVRVHHTASSSRRAAAIKASRAALATDRSPPVSSVHARAAALNKASVTAVNKVPTSPAKHTPNRSTNTTAVRSANRAHSKATHPPKKAPTPAPVPKPTTAIVTTPAKHHTTSLTPSKRTYAAGPITPTKPHTTNTPNKRTYAATRTPVRPHNTPAKHHTTNNTPSRAPFSVPGSATAARADSRAVKAAAAQHNAHHNTQNIPNTAQNTSPKGPHKAGEAHKNGDRSQHSAAAGRPGTLAQRVEAVLGNGTALTVQANDTHSAAAAVLSQEQAGTAAKTAAVLPPQTPDVGAAVSPQQTSTAVNTAAAVDPEAEDAARSDTDLLPPNTTVTLADLLAQDTGACADAHAAHLDACAVSSTQKEAHKGAQSEQNSAANSHKSAQSEQNNAAVIVKEGSQSPRSCVSSWGQVGYGGEGVCEAVSRVEGMDETSGGAEGLNKQSTSEACSKASASEVCSSGTAVQDNGTAEHSTSEAFSRGSVAEQQYAEACSGSADQQGCEAEACSRGKSEHTPKSAQEQQCQQRLSQQRHSQQRRSQLRKSQQQRKSQQWQSQQQRKIQQMSQHRKSQQQQRNSQQQQQQHSSAASSQCSNCQAGKEEECAPSPTSTPHHTSQHTHSAALTKENCEACSSPQQSTSVVMHHTHHTPSSSGMSHTQHTQHTQHTPSSSGMSHTWGAAAQGTGSACSGAEVNTHSRNSSKQRIAGKGSVTSSARHSSSVLRTADPSNSYQRSYQRSPAPSMTRTLSASVRQSGVHSRRVAHHSSSSRASRAGLRAQTPPQHVSQSCSDSYSQSSSSKQGGSSSVYHNLDLPPVSLEQLQAIEGEPEWSDVDGSTDSTRNSGHRRQLSRPFSRHSRRPSHLSGRLSTGSRTSRNSRASAGKLAAATAIAANAAARGQQQGLFLDGGEVQSQRRQPVHATPSPQSHTAGAKQQQQQQQHTQNRSPPIANKTHNQQQQQNGHAPHTPHHHHTSPAPTPTHHTTTPHHHTHTTPTPTHNRTTPATPRPMLVTTPRITHPSLNTTHPPTHNHHQHTSTNYQHTSNNHQHTSTNRQHQHSISSAVTASNASIILGSSMDVPAFVSGFGPLASARHRAQSLLNSRGQLGPQISPMIQRPPLTASQCHPSPSLATANATNNTASASKQHAAALATPASASKANAAPSALAVPPSPSAHDSQNAHPHPHHPSFSSTLRDLRRAMAPSNLFGSPRRSGAFKHKAQKTPRAERSAASKQKLGGTAGSSVGVSEASGSGRVNNYDSVSSATLSAAASPAPGSARARVAVANGLLASQTSSSVVGGNGGAV